MSRSPLIIVAVVALALAGAGSCSKPPGQAEYDRGLYELKRGNDVRAKALLEKSLTKRPGSEQNALAYNYIGLAAWRLGQYQAAQEAFEDSRRLSPSLMEPVYNLGVLLAASGDYAQAAKLLEDAAHMVQDDPRPLEQLGRMYTERQQWPDARRMLYAALDRSPHSPRVLTAIALVDLRAGGPQRAIESLMLALEQNSRYAPALFNLGMIYDAWLHDAVHARAYFKRYLSVAEKGTQADYAQSAADRLEQAAQTPAPPEEVAPPAAEDIPPVEPVPPSAPIASAPAADVSKEEPAEIEEVIKRAGTLADKGNMAGALKLCLEAADKAAREGDRDKQEKALRASARLCFDEPAAHYELGRFLFDQGRYDAALKSFKQAIVLNREYAPAHLGMAHAAIKTGELDAALVGLSSAVKADPKNADALWELAQLLDQNLHLNDKAIVTYREFEKKFPSDPRTLKAGERARALAPPLRAETPAPKPPPAVTTPPPPKAPERVSPAVRAAPVPVSTPRPKRQIAYKAPTARNTQAAVLAFNQGAKYQQQSNWDEAIRYYIRAIENDDRLTSAFYNLGIAYAMKGDGELAKDAYLHALELQPGLVSARYNLALLYYQARDFSSAAAQLQDVVRVKPDYAAAHYTMGLIYAENPATVPQAKEAYQRFLELAPNDPSAAVVRQWLATH